MTHATTTARDGTDGPDDRPLRWFFGVPFRARTYLNLCYLLLAFPLGIVYFTAVTVGFSLGFGLLVTLVGLPLFVLTLIGTTVLAAFDARLTSHLVGVDAPLPESLRAENPRSLSRAEDGVLDAISALVTAPTTWTSLVLVAAKFVYGILAFTVIVTAASVVLVALAAPLVYADPTITYTVGAHDVKTLPAALAVSVAGVLGGFLAMHLCNGLAIAGGRLSAALLKIDSSNPTRYQE
ncbi:sensor domain-containing protein [Natronorubrum sp. DTA7]|uniref:sensor domain-containing protein n=1 Tax=Natronorubrum sp. DTA7 TaxID=3447016 RepID=UPI003F87BEFC